MARKISSKKAETKSEDIDLSPREREESQGFRSTEPSLAQFNRGPEAGPTEGMSEQSYPTHKRILDFLEEFRKATVNIVFAGIVALLLLTVIKVINADELSIDPIGLPKAVRDLGYSEEGVALTLSDRMYKIFTESRLARHEFNVKAKSDDGDFAVPVAGLSFASAIRLIRQLAGFPQRHISGELICPSEPCNTSNAELHLRMMDGVHPPRAIDVVKGGNVEDIVSTAAEKLLRLSDPLSLSVFLYGDGPSNNARRPEAVLIANEIAMRGGPDRSAALNIIASDILESGTHEQAAIQHALGLLSLAIKEDPNYFPSYGNLASELAVLGNHKDAIANFKLAIEKGGNSPQLHKQLGISYAREAEYALSMAEFQTTLKLDPNDHVARNGWGITAMELGQLDEAIARFNEVITAKPDFIEAYYNLGIALKKKGSKNEARANLQKYLDMTADLEEKTKTMELLKSLE